MKQHIHQHSMQSYIQYVRESESAEAVQGIRIANDTDTTVDVIDPQTYQTLGIVPAKNI